MAASTTRKQSAAITMPAANIAGKPAPAIRPNTTTCVVDSEQVPDDPASQARRHHGERHDARVHQAARDRRRDGEGEESADKLSSPDTATAIRGGSAPVAIEVAMAFPVSWNPLVKSKQSAVMTTSTSTVSLLNIT
jgi:hypothetical protein